MATKPKGAAVAATSVPTLQFNPITDVLRTPCETLNLVGAGGLPFCQQIEVWGPNRGGKSTIVYQTVEYFLEDYGDGAMVLVLDAENAVVHDLRIRRVFKIDKNDPRVHFEPAQTLEEGQAHIGQYVQRAREQGKYLVVVWDSITVSQPKAEYQEIMKLYNEEVAAEDVKEYAGGMMLKPRLVRSMTGTLLSVMGNHPVVIFFINQVTAKITKFGATEDSGGGNGLKHNCGSRLHMDFQKALGESEYFKSGTMSFLNVNKSRTVPGLRRIPIFIQDQLGGRIVPGEEIAWMAKEMGMFKLAGGRYSINEDYLPDDATDAMRGSRYFIEWQRDQDAIRLLRDLIKADFRRNFQLVNWAWEDLEKELANGATLRGKIGADIIDVPDAMPEPSKGKTAQKRDALKAKQQAERDEAKAVRTRAAEVKASREVV